jgi:hypothetical protein
MREWFSIERMTKRVLRFILLELLVLPLLFVLWCMTQFKTVICQILLAVLKR